ncbi:MAG: hypothetical protein QOC94_3728, partial [Actinoplanes sp.]|nr:hypothetical protein [Actinoplanes sp.]
GPALVGTAELAPVAPAASEPLR